MKAAAALVLSLAAAIALLIAAHAFLPLTFYGLVTGASGPVPAYISQTLDLPVLGLFLLIAGGCIWAAYKLWRGTLPALGVLLVLCSFATVRDLLIDRHYRSSAIVLHRRVEPVNVTDREAINLRIGFEFDAAGAFLAAGVVMLYIAARQRRRAGAQSRLAPS